MLLYIKIIISKKWIYYNLFIDEALWVRQKVKEIISKLIFKINILPITLNHCTNYVNFSLLIILLKCVPNSNHICKSLTYVVKSISFHFHEDIIFHIFFTVFKPISNIF